jgi:hypothetical protein
MYGENLWGHFGFYDAFNPEVNWYADSYIAIDQGPIINMIENYRSGILWSAFMSNPEIQPVLDAIGFVEDPVSTDHHSPGYHWSIYPTMVDDNFIVQIEDADELQNWTITLIDQLGREVSAQVERSVNDEILFSVENINHTGWLWVVLQNNNANSETRIVWVQ